MNYLSLLTGIKVLIYRRGSWSRSNSTYLLWMEWINKQL